MREFVVDLQRVHAQLDELAARLNDPEVGGPLSLIENAASRIDKTWSQSWLGYHSLVYYKGFDSPPASSHFSSEWGLMQYFSAGQTTGEWREYTEDDVRREVLRLAGNPTLDTATNASMKCETIFEESRYKVLSILQLASTQYRDSFLKRLHDEVEENEVVSKNEYIAHIRPNGTFMSRDSLAASQGFRTPPHIEVIAEVTALRSPFERCVDLAKVALQSASHMERIITKQSRERRGDCPDRR